MTRKPAYIPEGYHSLTPTLTIRDASRFVDFARKAFDAAERGRITGPDGRLVHSEIWVGDSVIMLGEPMGDVTSETASLYLYVEDADATYRRALEAGATSAMEPADMFWGDRHGGVRDPFGNTWWISTRVEELTQEELQKRADEFFKSMASRS